MSLLWDSPIWRCIYESFFCYGKKLITLTDLGQQPKQRATKKKKKTKKLNSIYHNC